MQSQASDCGLACIAMVLAYHGHHISPAELRRQYGASSRGISLKRLVQICNDLGLNTRPIRTDLEYFNNIKNPVIVHWQFNHFVVVTRVKNGTIEILDPAVGKKKMSMEIFGRQFTGVVLELSPETVRVKPRVAGNLNLGFFAIPKQGIISNTLIILIVAVLFQALGLVPPLLVQVGVDTILPLHDTKLLLIITVGLVVIVLLQAAIMAFRGFVLARIGAFLQIHWISKLIGHTVRIPPEFFAKRHLGDVVSRFSSIDTVRRAALNTLFQFTINIVALIVTGTLMLYYNSLLTILSISFLGAFLPIQYWLSRHYFKESEEEIVAGARAQAKILEIVRGIATIRLSGLESDREMIATNTTIDSVNAGMRKERTYTVSSAVQLAFTSTENLAVLTIGFFLVMKGDLTIGMLLAFVAFKSQFVSAGYSIAHSFLDFSLLRMHLGRIAVLTTEQKDLTLANIETGLSNPSGAIIVENLGFRYSEDDPWVFNNMSFTIEQGKTVAIVGKSGCGKTTLFKILLGLLPATKGSISIGEIPLGHTNWHWLREQVGVVLQDDWLFAGRIVDNIVPVGEQVNIERVRHVCGTACIRGDIESMPMAYYTLTGDAGSTLSAGQRQRLMLARALYREPSMLFLDEFTSFLDRNTEVQILQNLKELNITILMIAHRPETISNADSELLVNSDEFKPFPKNAVVR